MHLDYFICIMIGMILTSIFHHLYYYNGKILIDKKDPSNDSFRLCILKLAVLRKRKYIVLKIEHDHYINER